MRTSETTDILDAALAKAQAEIENPSKDAVNPHFRSKYATLDAGLNIVRACLSKHGINVTQPTRVEDGILMLDTRLACQGQWIASEYPVCPFPIKQQEMGSALTYSRRYSLFSLIGIAGEEDDDANAATTPTQAPKRATKPAAPAIEKMSAELSATARAAAILFMDNAATIAELDKWGVDNRDELARMQDDDVAAVRAVFKSHRDALNSKKEAA